jgi:hypothetical protein
LGGFTFPHDEETVRKFKEWKYILDGQQRATSILISLHGGTCRVEGNEDFDYTLYFDATVGDFFFVDELADRRERVVNPIFLARVRDVPEWDIDTYTEFAQAAGYDETIKHNLSQIQRMFNRYKLSVIYIKGVEVAEVCEIFERINQEGKKLDPVDILVARTYRNPNPEIGYAGFYLREQLRELKQRFIDAGSRWQDIDELALIQMFAMCLRKEHKHGRNPFGITPTALNNLETSHFEERWVDARKTILETVKFLLDQKIAGPAMLPFAYLAMPLCFYFHDNRAPNRDLARQWFWRNAFGLDTFGNSSDVYRFSEEFFARLETGATVSIAPLTLSKTRLVHADYYYRGSLSRAVLAFLANLRPIDFSDPHAEVLDSVYLLLSQAPNLHHFYPRNFLAGVPGLPWDVSADSLMNICYLRAKTNIQISDDNPLDYIKNYKDIRNFDQILASHLLPTQFLERKSFIPNDYRDFLFARADLFASKVRDALPNVEITITG